MEKKIKRFRSTTGQGAINGNYSPFTVPPPALPSPMTMQPPPAMPQWLSMPPPTLYPRFALQHSMDNYNVPPIRAAMPPSSMQPQMLQSPAYQQGTPRHIPYAGPIMHNQPALALNKNGIIGLADRQYCCRCSGILPTHKEAANNVQYQLQMYNVAGERRARTDRLGVGPGSMDTANRADDELEEKLQALERRIDMEFVIAD